MQNNTEIIKILYKNKEKNLHYEILLFNTHKDLNI